MVKYRVHYSKTRHFPFRPILVVAIVTNSNMMLWEEWWQLTARSVSLVVPPCYSSPVWRLLLAVTVERDGAHVLTSTSTTSCNFKYCLYRHQHLTTLPVPHFYKYISNIGMCSDLLQYDYLEQSLHCLPVPHSWSWNLSMFEWEINYDLPPALLSFIHL